MAATIDPSLLDELKLFAGLSEADLEPLLPLLHSRQVAAETRLMSSEQPGEAVYLLLDGAVKVQALEEDGTEVTLAVLGPGDTVGEMSLLESAGRSADVVTLQDSTVLWMDRDSFLRCLDTVPRLAANLLRELSSRLRSANLQIRALSTMDVAGRVARQILSFADEYGRSQPDGIEIPLPFTQSEIAEMIGATRERVNRVMVELKRDGVLSVDPQHHITVHDRERLESLTS